MDEIDILMTLGAFLLIITYPWCAMYSYSRLNYEWNYNVEDRQQWYRNRDFALITSILLSWISMVYLYVADYNGTLLHSTRKDCRLWLKSEDPLYKQTVEHMPDNSLWAGYNGIPQSLERRYKKL